MVVIIGEIILNSWTPPPSPPYNRIRYFDEEGVEMREILVVGVVWGGEIDWWVGGIKS